MGENSGATYLILGSVAILGVAILFSEHFDILGNFFFHGIS